MKTRNQAPLSVSEDSVPEYRESKAHYYFGLFLLVGALLGLAWQMRTSRLLFFDAVLAFREGQKNESEQHGSKVEIRSSDLSTAPAAEKASLVP